MSDGPSDDDDADQAEHDRWFARLLKQLQRHGSRRGAEWHRRMAEAPRLDRRDPLELREIICDAEPATVDDVPWTFRVQTPLEPADGPPRGYPGKTLAPLCIVCLPFQHPLGPRTSLRHSACGPPARFPRRTTPPTDPRFERPPRSPLASPSTSALPATLIPVLNRPLDRLTAPSAPSHGVPRSLRLHLARHRSVGQRRPSAGAQRAAACSSTSI
jgi:hypothetical protein